MMANREEPAIGPEAGEPDMTLARFAELNNMLVNLQRDLAKKNADLKHNSRFLESILETTPSLIYVYDLEESSCTYANVGVETFVGLTGEQALLSMGDRHRTLCDERDPSITEPWRSAVLKLADAEVLETENRVQDSKDVWRWLVCRDKVLARDREGAPRQILRVANEITRRREAEIALGEAVSDLERSNRDLEQFAFVASHDLKEPLRMVSSYLELIKKRYHGKLDEDADEFIDFAADGAARMQQLLETLLDYARVGSDVRELRAVDSEAVVKQALANLGGVVLDAQAQIDVGELPVVLADETQLMRVFQNLIANAVKSRELGTEPHVRISAHRDEDLWQFSIADNGTGIDPDEVEHVFEIFQRSHAHTDHPGTGIGLAVCRRIVERLGGSIWIESSGAAGTTFCFTLPAA
jgi:signal transduction histidine kinase